MSGLRKALITRGMALGKANRPQNKPVPKFGYGGDVEGGRDEGVGGSNHDSNPGDFGGFAADSSGGMTSESLGEAMGNYADSHGGGETSSVGGGFDFNGIAADTSVDWNGAMEGATLGGLMDGVSFSGGDTGDNFSSIDLSGSLPGLGLGLTTGFGDFGGYTSSGAIPGSIVADNLTKPATSDVDFSTDDLGGYQTAGAPRTPSEGTLAAISRASTLDTLVDKIAELESRGQKDPYSAVGNKTRTGDRAYGFSQVMGTNVPAWSEDFYGDRLSKKEYLGNPEAQRAVTRGRLGELMDKYGPVQAAEAWFAGEQGMLDKSRKDVNGMSVGRYGNAVAEALGLNPSPPSAFPESVPTPPARPADPFGPSMVEGDPLAAGRIASLESGHLPGISYGNQDAINASLMGELTGPQAQARADEQDRVGRGQGPAPAAAPVSAAQEVANPATSLAASLGTGTLAPDMDFSVADLGAGQPATTGKDQARVAERSDLPALTSDVNAPARAAMGDLNAQPSTGARPAAPAAPSNSIAETISGFFGFDTPKAAAAPAAPAAAPDFDAAFATDATARQAPGSMAALSSQPAVQTASVTPPADLPAPAARPAALSPEEEAAAPSVAGRGTRTAGTSVVAQDRTNTPQTRAAPTPGAPARGVATDDTYGPTMPGMAPGMTTYPERGIINQPSTWAHEKIAERLGAGAARGVGSALTGGIFGLADMGSGFLGGPSLSGLFANSTPGLDLSLGTRDGNDRVDPRTSGPAEDKPQSPAKPSTGSKGSSGGIQTQPTYAARYIGPPRDPKTYGYGGERVMWKGDAYARGGYVDCAPQKSARRGGALPTSQGIKAKSKRMA